MPQFSITKTIENYVVILKLIFLLYNLKL